MIFELQLVYAVFSFALGAAIASFLNVVIWRVPRGESVVSPPSHCPKCNAPIKWYQNLPILSWLALRGRCANCREPISPRYIIIETLGGCLFLAAFVKFGLVFPIDPLAIIHLLVMWIWLALMIAGAMIDFDHQLLPDFTTIGGMVLGVVEAGVMTTANFMAGGGHSTLERMLPLVDSLSGLAFGFGLLWLVRFFGSKAFKREAMGMGDVFLMGAVGSILGPVAVLVTLIVSSVLGSLVGVGMMLVSKVRLGMFKEIPFGPYICLACLIYIFRGPELIAWYLDLFRVAS